MSDVTNIYARLVTLVNTALPNHKRLANPYEPATCSALQLAKGFGICLDGSENTNRVISGSTTMVRAFRIVLTVLSTGRETDGAARGAVELALFEDALLVVKAMELDPSASENAMNLRWLGDTGVEFVEGDQDGSPGFYKTELQMQIEYREPLS